MRQAGANIITGLTEFQFTHPRGVRRRRRSKTLATARVSIHAPARGATFAPSPRLYFLDVSIHAPARGATAVRHRGQSGVRRFNSRTREGCDPGRCRPVSGGGGFNSRTREGCDLSTPDGIPTMDWFQFTHPRGVRQVADRVREQWLEFQFTHPRGVRLIHGSANNANAPFQFTHPRGVRPASDLKYLMALKFQFTHPRGVRRHQIAGTARHYVFQFTHPRGVRRRYICIITLGLSVSIHAPARGATKTTERKRGYD